MRVLNERQAKILESLETKRYISVSELSDKLKVSVVTIRKDLTLLEQEGYLHRTHGGASKQMRYVFDQTVSEKETLNVEEKTRIIDKALDYIKENALRAGDSLPKELEFAETLGVSRTAIREAMLRLRTLGLIESRKHRGMVILEPDLVHNFEKMLDPALIDVKRLSNLFELRLMLEVGMADFVFARKTAKQLKELEDIVKNSEEQRCDSFNFYLEEEKQFHGKLYEMAGNDLLKNFQNVFMPIFQYVHDLNRYQTAYILPEGSKQVSHRDLLEELKQGTPASFRELMREHLNPHYIKVLGISC